MKAIALVTLFLSSSVHAENLTVSIVNITSKSGRLAWALFNQVEAFPAKRDRALRKDFIPIANREKIEVIISDLQADTYAIAIFLDANGNSQLDKNFFGYPLESIGFSSNPKLLMGPPRFRECQFDFPITKNLEIRMLQ